ncbi:MAG: hypothetical protein COX57_09640 [Alphaproteobacteria bacterium CG_4_10_14_0_2_um_filter_63_37]|nr:MAG: hypothetical protein AUJ55_10130 [Proteobacteria bacterium CG1_02_64_396]PJA24222.1 MAG: hypothetical protein COX57_09640 [Alphaproteobacteria bacterium CG_4_10_14_0_2_um_filter_63_37]
MFNLLLWLVGLFLLLATGVVAARIVGERLQRLERETLLHALHTTIAPWSPSRISFAKELPGLPEPVARYFKAVLRDDDPIPRRIHVVQRGRFRIGTSESGWRSMTAEEFFTHQPPGFVWLADIAMAPGFTIKVSDHCIAGHGGMKATVLGIDRLALADPKPSPELDLGALQRYLAEAVWFPFALLPSQGVRWLPIDAHTARARLQAGRTVAELDFSFDSEGLPVQALTPARPREVSGHYENRPWLCQYEKYGNVNGVRIPLAGRASWILPEGVLTYWEGGLERVDFA